MQIPNLPTAKSPLVMQLLLHQYFSDLLFLSNIISSGHFHIDCTLYYLRYLRATYQSSVAPYLKTGSAMGVRLPSQSHSLSRTIPRSAPIRVSLSFITKL